MHTDNDLGAAMGQWAIEKKADEAKAAIIGLSNRIAYLENALDELQKHVGVLHDLVMKK